NSAEVTQDRGLYGEDLRVFYKKKVKEDEKSKAETDRLLATT
ncbi:5692_t:CDS:1, partial [Funneliformis geosporum]